MKTKVPTLEEMKVTIISCLTMNVMPKGKDELAFLNLIIEWENGETQSLARRQTFAQIFSAFKKRCVHKDEVGRKNEMWAAINAIRPVWIAQKDFILTAIKKTKKDLSPSFFESISNLYPFKKKGRTEDYDGQFEVLTWIHH
ncbi:MAG: hypothetical protein JWL92_140 [Candidatus Nomurabacteria bacterium]|nr:hypothetical protein [Candidatus Nomurabacteria bacterium]